MSTLLPTLSLSLLSLWLLLPIALLLVAGHARLKGSNPANSGAWGVAERLFLTFLGVTIAIGLWLLVPSARVEKSLEQASGALGLFPNGLSFWMALLVSFIGWVILRYARDYLRGDPAAEHFLPGFLTTIVSVLVLVTTNNLFLLAAAWIGVSLSLHQLLTLYSDREQARLAAAKKFISSRLGDLAILVAVFLIWKHTGTYHISELHQARDAGSGLSLEMASVLLAVAAVLKCAQIPFHGWLLRVMEAPTPVSALLHAGVINLGGFLWLRLFPVFDGFTAGHWILLVFGGATALIASLAMMTQSSAKHALVWSTNAQMGFMLFEIALGAYTLAFLHLLAHSLYKAHSFLAAGRTVNASAIQFESGVCRLQFGLSLLGMGLAGSLLWFLPGLVEGKSVLGAVLVLAVGAMVMGAPTNSRLISRLWTLGLAVALVPTYAVLNSLLAPALPASPEFSLPLAASIVGWVFLIGLAGLSWLLMFRPQAAWFDRLHWNMSQGLLLDRPFERLIRRWAGKLLLPKPPRKQLRASRTYSGELV
ncbi:MAG: NADH-quinone oxidoreductase subunit L [Pseudomonadota bacterium]